MLPLPPAMPARCLKLYARTGYGRSYLPHRRSPHYRRRREIVDTLILFAGREPAIPADFPAGRRKWADMLLKKQWAEFRALMIDAAEIHINDADLMTQECMSCEAGGLLLAYINHRANPRWELLALEQGTPPEWTIYRALACEVLRVALARMAANHVGLYSRHHTGCPAGDYVGIKIRISVS